MENKPSSPSLHQGFLYRYVAETFFKKSYWKDCWAVLESNGTLRIYKDKDDADDQGKSTSEFDLIPLALYLSFGEDARKLNPPNIRHEDYRDTPNLIAIPKDKDRQVIHWFFAPTESDIRLWIKYVARSVSPHNKPPLLGSKRGDDEKIIDEVRYEFSIDDYPNEWEIYWLSLILAARKKEKTQSKATDRIESLSKTIENLTDDEKFINNQSQQRLSIPDRDLNISPLVETTSVTTNSKMFYHAEKMLNGATRSEIIVHIENRNGNEEEATTEWKQWPDENQNTDYINIHLLENEQNHLKTRLDEKSIHAD